MPEPSPFEQLANEIMYGERQRFEPAPKATAYKKLADALVAAYDAAGLSGKTQGVVLLDDDTYVLDTGGNELLDGVIVAEIRNHTPAWFTLPERKAER